MATNLCTEKGKTNNTLFPCLTDLQEKFTAKINWNENPLLGVGCYKTNQVFPKHVVEMEFKKFQSGDIRIKFGPFDTYLLTQDGQLKEFKSLRHSTNGTVYELVNPPRIPAKFSNGAILGFRLTHYKANEAFYMCYQSSTEQNTHLTDQQKEVVERFFAAVKTTFPQEFTEK